MAKEKKACAKSQTKADAPKAKSCKSCKAAAPKPVPFKPLTKGDIVQQLADATALSKKDVTLVLDNIAPVIAKSLASSNDASFTLPGLIKIEKQFVPAKEGQKNVPDPFHPGQTVDRPARPEHYKINVKALKGLKDMA